MGQVTYKEIKNLEEVNEYIRQGNEMLGALGFTDHSTEHALIVATKAGKILQKLNYGKRDIELAKIAGYLHDLGNCINRTDHAHLGALLAKDILKECGMNYTMMDYFEIFLQRMLMCKRAAEVLGMRFKMTANGNKIC